MAGWLEWFEEKIICPYCGYQFIALFCEEGDPNRIPIVITDLAGSKAECPDCKFEITYKDLYNSINKW